MTPLQFTALSPGKNIRVNCCGHLRFLSSPNSASSRMRNMSSSTRNHAVHSWKILQIFDVLFFDVLKIFSQNGQFWLAIWSKSINRNPLYVTPLLNMSIPLLELLRILCFVGFLSIVSGGSGLGHCSSFQFHICSGVQFLWGERGAGNTGALYFSYSGEISNVGLHFKYKVGFSSEQIRDTW